MLVVLLLDERKFLDLEFIYVNGGYCDLRFAFIVAVFVIFRGVWLFF